MPCCLASQDQTLETKRQKNVLCFLAIQTGFSPVFCSNIRLEIFKAIDITCILDLHTPHTFFTQYTSYCLQCREHFLLAHYWHFKSWWMFCKLLSFLYLKDNNIWGRAICPAAFLSDCWFFSSASWCVWRRVLDVAEPSWAWSVWCWSRWVYWGGRWASELQVASIPTDVPLQRDTQLNLVNNSCASSPLSSINKTVNHYSLAGIMNLLKTVLSMTYIKEINI